MPIDNIIVKETEYNGKKILQLYIVFGKKEYLIGTLKDKSYNNQEILYINCIHKEFKKN